MRWDCLIYIFTGSSFVEVTDDTERSVPLEEEFTAYISQEKEECHAGPQGKHQVLVRRQKQGKPGPQPSLCFWWEGQGRVEQTA